MIGQVDLTTQIAFWLHVFASIFWIGSLLFLAFVAAPLTERVRPPSFQRELSRMLWQRAHRAMWIAVAAIAITGLLRMYMLGMLNRDLITLGFWGSKLGLKLIFVGGMVALSALHDVLLGPGARMKDPRASTDPPHFAVGVLPTLIALAGMYLIYLSSTF
jgi:uncharacterized membrane protein